MSELLAEMSDYFDINDGFTKHVQKMKEAQKVAANVDVNLINDATLLRMGLETMYSCGLFEKAFDEWEEIDSSNHTWSEFQTHFQNVEENFHLKKKNHDKKGGVGQAHDVTQDDACVPCNDPDVNLSNIDTYLDNLAAVATQEKDVLDKLVSDDSKLVSQLEILTSKFNQLSNQSSTSTVNNIPMLNGKKLKFV